VYTPSNPSDSPSASSCSSTLSSRIPTPDIRVWAPTPTHPFEEDDQEHLLRSLETAYAPCRAGDTDLDSGNDVSAIKDDYLAPLREDTVDKDINGHFNAETETPEQQTDTAVSALILVIMMALGVIVGAVMAYAIFSEIQI